MKPTNQTYYELSKIDNLAVDGLLGTEDSIGYILAELDAHAHNWEDWFGAAAVPNAEIHVADLIDTAIVSFQIDAGNDDWGSWVQVLGSGDTPARAGNLKYDLHEVLVVATERASASYFIQLAFGTSGAAAYAAGDYTTVGFFSPATVNRSAAIPLLAERQDITTKAWARCICIGQNTATLNFYFGLHEYIG